VIRSLRLSLSLIAFSWSAPLLAEDPVPTPMPMPVQDLIVIVAPDAEVSGVGTRKDPFAFTPETVCALELTGTAKGVKWKLDDAPPKSIWRGNLVSFPLVTGEFILAAEWEGGSSRNYWFKIKGPNGPPQPTNALASRLRAAITGPDAAKDAVQFAAIMRGVADAVEANPPATHKPLKALWDATLKSNSWPAGKYPFLPDVGRMAIPTADETTTIDAVQLAVIVTNLRTLQKTAEAIGNGK